MDDAKKIPERFTVPFDTTDPEHAEAVEILNATKRRKADKIAKALVFYQRHSGNVSSMVYERKPQEPVTSSDGILSGIDDALDAFGID